MKLTCYSALAATLLGFLKESNGQIVYTDIADTVLHAGNFYPGNNYYLDLNNDGISDFNFYLRENLSVQSNNSQFFTAAFTENIPGNPNQLEGFAASNLFYPELLAAGDTVGAAKPWIETGELFLGYHHTLISTTGSGAYAGITIASNGQWLNETNGFLGLRLIQNTDTLYGWVRMDVFLLDSLVNNQYTRDSVVIKDFAYNTVPGEMIIAGDTGGITGIAEVPVSSSIVISPNPANNYITVLCTMDNRKVALITIRDFSGKEVLSRSVANSSVVEIDIASLMEGFYFIEVKNGTENLIGKFLVKR